MSALLLSLLPLLAQGSDVATGAQLRALTVTLVDEKGREVQDVSPDDVALTENGVHRDIASFKRDDRPLTVAILVDTSADVASAYRLNAVDALVGLVSRLPEGTRYALWTTGDRPTKVVDYTEDRAAAGTALRHVAPQGGNYMLDALAEASDDLNKAAKEEERRAVIAVSGMGPEFSYRDKQQAADDAERKADLFLSVQVDSGAVDMDVRQRLSYTLDRLASASGGRADTVMSYMALDGALRRLSAYLVSAYRLRYASVPDLKKRKLELRVARPGTKVLIPQLALRDESKKR